MSEKNARRLVTALVSLGLLVLLGCGDETGLPRRYPVRGAVTYNGEPVEKGLVNFAPVDPEGRAASGAIVNGRYTLTTATEGDGAIPGRYRVTITAKDIDISEVMAKAGGGAGRPIDMKIATEKAKDLVPPKYSSLATSELEAEVQAQSNTIDFQLTD